MIDIVISFIKSPKLYGPILTILCGIIVYSLISNFLRKATIKGKNEFDKKRRKTLLDLFDNIIKYIVVLIACIIILNIFGVNTTSILAGLGIASIVIGLALQDALKDIIGGINIIMDNYFVIGDLVQYNDFTGYIISFGLKTTKIKDLDGKVLIISNRNIDSIVNISQKNHILRLNIPTAYETKAEDAKKALNRVLEIIKKDEDVIADECEYSGINELGESSISYLIKVSCKPASLYRVRRKILELVKEEYEKANIKIPYNQIEVHNGSKI